ncbi:MAG: hypothetical protein NZM37_10070 [Sandaracinaceae bacterium]|nr:hypothetical protein [Sandaracinaceae bacterium]MDW8246757.1 hypothetical protein [Sandaracinaceae bacterium]
MPIAKINPVSCTHISSCELFPLLEKGGFLKVWQSRYCRGDFSRCARYQMSLRGERPPINLLPSGEYLSCLKRRDECQ